MLRRDVKTQRDVTLFTGHAHGTGFRHKPGKGNSAFRFCIWGDMPVVPLVILWFADTPEGPLILIRAALLPAIEDDCERLLHHLLVLVLTRIDTIELEVGRGAAGTEAEQDAPTGHVIELCEFKCQANRM